MVVVDSVALAITVSNDLVMPVLLRGRAGAGERGGGRDRRARAAGAAPGDPRRADRSAIVYARLAGARRSPRSACCRSPRWRRSRRRSSAAWSGGAAPRAAPSPAWRSARWPGSISCSCRRSTAERRAQRLPRRGAARRRLAEAGRAHRLFAPIRWSAASFCRSAPILPPIVARFADAAGDAARTPAGDRLRRRRAERQAAGVPPVARLDHGRRARGDGGALPRRGAGAARLRELPAERGLDLDAGRRGRRASRSATPSTCCRRRSALRPRAWCCRCLLRPPRHVGQVGAEAARRRRRRRSSRAATSCSTRSTTRARASPSSTPISRSPPGTASSPTSSTCRRR